MNDMPRHGGFSVRSAKLKFEQRPLVPKRVIDERDRRLLAAPRSLTASVFGDPPPGRSALDRKLCRLPQNFGEGEV